MTLLVPELHINPRILHATTSVLNDASTKAQLHSEYEKIASQNFKCRHCAQHVKSADIVRLKRHVRDCDHAPGATRVNTQTSLSVHSSSTSIPPAENALGVGNHPNNFVHPLLLAFIKPNRPVLKVGKQVGVAINEISTFSFRSRFLDLL
ncbi:hypothetical protein E4U51_004605 [Claviceps purpurea]|nr:hypothetical protein E4U51_004605 [Claviceps purpurea]